MGYVPPLTTELAALDRDLDAESLEVDDDGENDNSREQAHNIRKPLSPESRTTCIMSREQEVEQRNDGMFKLGS